MSRQRLPVKWTGLLAAVSCLLSACALNSINPGDEAASPAVVIYKDVRGGKPEMRTYTLKLDLVNRNDQPKWYVMRYLGDRELPHSGIVWARQDDNFQFGTGVLSAREQAPRPVNADPPSTQCLVCYGNFMAIKLAAHQELHIDDYAVEAFSPIDSYEVMEVSDILINQSTPLEQWIAARTFAPEGYFVTLTDANRDPDNPTRIRREAPPEKVDLITSLTFQNAQRWTLPIGNIANAKLNPWARAPEFPGSRLRQIN